MISRLRSAAESSAIPTFDLAVPTTLAGVDAQVLDPRSSYTNPSEWQEKAQKLASLFVENFQQYTDNEKGRALVAAGPKS